MVEGLDEVLVDEAFEVGEGEVVGWWGVEIDGDAGLDAVVVAVAAGVVALAEGGAVLFVGEGGDVEAVGGGEVEALAHEGDGIRGGFGRGLVCHAELQAVGRRDGPSE